jgi:hypothetical protein
LAALVLIVAGCADWRLQAGLANAPSLNRTWTDEDFRHDAIANGDESCPASGRAEDDPLVHRWPKCGASILPVRLPAPPHHPTRPGPLAEP